VHGSTLGIVGLGRIGKAVARRARGFGMRILYTGPTAKPAAERELGVMFRSLPDLLAEADHVVLLAPLTLDNHHLIGAAALAFMKPTAILVNAARGGLVDPAALFQALRDGGIAAAGLDVTEPEPIPPDDPLLGLPNCVILPHLGSASRRTRVAMARLAAANLLAGLRGEVLPAVANPEVYASS
jgi:phosphoglycerate dehydrogenase-like enzyme